MNPGRLRSQNRFLSNPLPLAILIVLMTMVSIAPDSKTGPSPSSPSSGDVNIWLNGDAVGPRPGWTDTSPGPTITVVSGETVNLLLNATDFLSHNWYIDVNNNSQPDTNETSSPDFSPNTKALPFTFTPTIGQNIPSAGNWTYKCRYHPYSMYGTIRVIRPDFFLSAAPSSLATTVRTMGTSTITVHPLFSFTGTVNLSITASSGLQATISPPSIGGASGTATLTIVALNSRNYTTTVTGTSGPISHSLNVTIEAGDFTTTADPPIVPAQIVISPTVLMGLGVSTLSCVFASSGQFVVNVTATNGSLVHSVIVTFDVAVPDYLVASSPNSITMLAGVAGNSTISLQSINGFTGTVNLSALTSQGLNCTLSSTSITLGASGTATLSCRGSAGVYVATVTGTNGVTSRSSSVSYSVQDFTITSDPTILTVDAGATSAPTITIVPLEEFSGTVSVKVEASTGLTATVSPSSVARGSGIATLTFSATEAGNYTANVTATSNTLTHSLKLTAQVQDFTIASNSTAFHASVNQARASSIRISSINHFARTVVMTINNTYCGAAPVETTNGNTTLSCNFPVEGTFHITVTGTSGSLSHSVTLIYVVSSIQQVPETSLLGLLPIAAAISSAALVISLILFTRHRTEIRRRTATSLWSH